MMKKGFTLAEVLITLAVIGVVAALTMPNLIAKHQEKELVASAKKVYSVFSQAFVSAINENGSPESWEVGASYTDSVGNTNLFNKFVPYVKFAKTCEAGDTSDCFNVPDTNIGRYVKVGILQDGAKVYMFSRSRNCSMVFDEIRGICGDLSYEYKNSALRFWITKNGIVPKGTTIGRNSVQGFENCLKRAKSINDFPEGCTAWIVLQGNMDFLHCKDLDWSGKTSCK